MVTQKLINGTWSLEPWRTLATWTVLHAIIGLFMAKEGLNKGLVLLTTGKQLNLQPPPPPPPWFIHVPRMCASTNAANLHTWREE